MDAVRSGQTVTGAADQTQPRRENSEGSFILERKLCLCCRESESDIASMFGTENQFKSLFTRIVNHRQSLTNLSVKRSVTIHSDVDGDSDGECQQALMFNSPATKNKGKICFYCNINSLRWSQTEFVVCRTVKECL